MAITTAAAIIGGSALLGAGSSIIAGNKAAGAARDGAEAAAAASERSTQLQIEEARRQYDTTRGDYAPYRQAGVGALGALQGLYGLPTTPPPGGASSGGAPRSTAPDATPWASGYDNGAYERIAAKAPGGVDWAAYVAGNPDAAAQWANQTPDLASFGGAVDNFGEFHYVNDGARRDLSSYQGAPAPAEAPPVAPSPGTAINAGIPGPDYTDIGTRPDYGDVGTAPDYREIGEAPDYSSIGSGPAYRAPDYANFTESPGYQFRLKRGIAAVKANASMRGLLGSTKTMKGIEDFAEGQAADEYDAFYNRATAAADNQYARDRSAYDTAYNRITSGYDTAYNRITAGYDSAYNRTTSAFDADYNRRTSAYDAYANRLAALAGVGQTATAATANAGSSATSTIANAYGANGTNQANAATARGNATASAYTNLGSAINSGASNLASLYLYQNGGGFGGTPYSRTGMI